MLNLKVVNLTPHDIVLRCIDGSDMTIERSGTVARVSTVPGTEMVVLPIGNGVQRFWHTSYKDVEGLPPPAENTIYIVSAMVADRVSRVDVYAPGTGPDDGCIRNEKGHVVAVTRLICSW
jgi:hypothetical protein